MTQSGNGGNPYKGGYNEQQPIPQYPAGAPQIPAQQGGITFGAPSFSAAPPQGAYPPNYTEAAIPYQQGSINSIPRNTGAPQGASPRSSAGVNHPVRRASSYQQGGTPPIKNAGSGYIPPYAAGGFSPRPIDRPKRTSSGGGSKKPPVKRKRPLGVTLAIAAAVIGLLVFGGFKVYDALIAAQVSVIDKTSDHEAIFAGNIYLDDIPLGGMTAEQGYNAALSNLQQRYANWFVQLAFNGFVWTITPDTISMQTDLATRLDEAWSIGRVGNNEQRKAALDALSETPVYLYSQVTYTTEPISRLLDEIAAFIYTPARDATVSDFTGDNFYTPFVYTDEVSGVMLDTDATLSEVMQKVEHMESAILPIHTISLSPKVTKTELMLDRTLRGKATTVISNTSTENRNSNVALSLSRINGTVLENGQQLSFNKKVGMRSAKNGFLEALEYAYGELRDGIGGGVCQSSTTIYQGALLAGMDIVKRTAHSDIVNYTQLGQDATVMYTRDRTIDLVIKNNTGSNLYFLCGVMSDPSNSKRLITYCYVYGRSLGDTTYELESNLIETIKAPEEPEYRSDTNGKYVTYIDETYVTQKKRDGYVYQTFRITKQNGVEVGRVMLSEDTYRARPAIIYTGTQMR
ncbi:MAG: VanW family protein [Eubacteriales bacterium]|nr:VanW family protein [Eubacteriales bacterium]MDD3882248.1 VanW family protein [Eubacteriales bacterium]MDD4512597.1 VanW family protein [Eubacteriales bacterium]